VVENIEVSEATKQPILADRILLWPFYWGLLILFIINIALIWPFAEFAFSIAYVAWAPPFAILIIVLLFLALWTAFRAALRGHWRSAISASVLPALMALAVPTSFATSWAADQIHYRLFEREYLASIAFADNMKNGRLVFFDWGGGPMIGFSRFLVFDESDEIILPAQKRSKSFETKLTDHGFTGHEEFRIIQTVAPHFYVVDRC
jgi:hypothetical protein